MMKELDQNKANNEELLQQLEDEKKAKEELEKRREEMIKEENIQLVEVDVNERKYPYLMNISDDPSLLGLLIYDLKEGPTKVGTKEGDDNNIKINGIGIATHHCVITNQKESIDIEPCNDAKIFVNGVIIKKKVGLNHLDRVTFGHSINFKLVIPGRGTADELRMSLNAVGQYGDYIDGKLSAKTLEAKSMKQFIQELEQRLPKFYFKKFLDNFKDNLEKVDIANEITELRYNKIPLRSKNLRFKCQVLIDIENYMKGVPEMVFICEHRETKEVMFVWAEEKFEARLEEMTDWWKGDTSGASTEFDAWFDATDHFIKEKNMLEQMTSKELAEYYHKKQADNAELVRKLREEQKSLRTECKEMGYSDNNIEDYADFYMRGFEVSKKVQEKLTEMRKNEKAHKAIGRFMEVCGEVEKCHMDNTYFISMKDKYTKKGAAGGGENIAASSRGNAGGGGKSSGGYDDEKEWLNQKIEELQDELKRRAQIINKLKRT